tara:strand:- start:376 stop:996 length:621 start_codon:yes stop_codon:yes gene_type:complete
MSTKMEQVKSEMEQKIEIFINTFKKEEETFENMNENLMQLFFELHLHCSKVAIKTNISKKSSKKKSNLGNFASKKAKEFAEENGLKEEDIKGTGKNGKITKKDIVPHLPKKKKAETEKKEEPRKKTPCNGLTNSGNACKRIGSHKPEGASNYYCYKCVKDWELREKSNLSDNLFSGSESEDSDDEYFENLKKEEKKKPKKMQVYNP